MIPCFNAARSLRWAVGSLLAQEFEAWECLIVDDGSTDGTWDLLQRLDDPRIRCQRLPTNRGRGWARAAALEMAASPYIAMIDADDWIYPDKLATQLAVLAERPDVALVSSAMAITDTAGSLTGRQGPVRDEHRPPLVRLSHADIPHASSLLRTSIVREAGYDRSLRLCEDKDLLLKIRQRYPAYLLSAPSYVYAQPGSMSFAKVAASYAAELRIFGKYGSEQPVRALMLSAEAIAKREVYRACYAAGLEDRLIAKRWVTPSPVEVERFERARATVATHVSSLESRWATL